ncbi:MAG TPA: hypothetical protein VH164_13225 [Ktedonobacteraceae bacterium]|nr:hypothetical protein [Ktedonobacteraceae bacterium]
MKTCSGVIRVSEQVITSIVLNFLLYRKPLLVSVTNSELAEFSLRTTWPRTMSLETS